MKYTIPHSLPIIEPATDFVASPSAGNLNKDLNTLAGATNTALSAVRAAGQYDTGQAIQQAQNYSDQAKLLAGIEAKQLAVDQSAKALADSKSYTDVTNRAGAEVAAQYARTQDSQVLDAAKDYANQVLQVSNIGIDVDGTPFFSPGSVDPIVRADADGTPYFEEL